jgi:hypothetical protein
MRKFTKDDLNRLGNQTDNQELKDLCLAHAALLDRFFRMKAKSNIYRNQLNQCNNKLRVLNKGFQTMNSKVVETPCGRHLESFEDKLGFVNNMFEFERQEARRARMSGEDQLSGRVV